MQPEPFSDPERRLLEPYFTNLDRNVFALKNLPQVVCGTLFSRYSRSPKLLRRLLLEEFMQSQELEFAKLASVQAGKEDGLVATRKAEEFYDRVLVDYGDDSVAELGGAHLACEQVSNIAAKVLEDSRIGLSPLEKSTRYVYWDQKVEGNYQYFREPLLMESRHADLYLETCDSLFDTYCRLLEPVKKFFTERFPRQENVSDRAYTATIKAKTCDTLRGLLPAATLTNVGLYGNGRAFEYLLSKMHASPLREIHSLAGSMHEELAKVIPSFVKRGSPSNEFGNTNISFLKEQRARLEALAEEALPSSRSPSAASPVSVQLLDWDQDAEEKVLSSLLFPHSSLSLPELRKRAKALSLEEKKGWLSSALSHRANRRHKPPRAFELAHYTFELVGNFGMYRDLQRHRMLTQERQPLSCQLGFDVPGELKEAGFGREFLDAMKKAQDTFSLLRKTHPREAQYVVPFAFRLRWYFHLSLRELYHLCELRSVQAGHPDYRRMAQQMFLEVKKVHPLLVEHMKFVDLKEYKLERLESEKATDKKIEEVKKKYGG